MNLLTNHWIQVEMHDGSMTEISAKEAILNGSAYRDLAGDPLVKAAILYILLAIVHRGLQYKSNKIQVTFSQLQKIIESDKFPPEVSNYVHDKKIVARFELQGDRPFLQTPGMDSDPKEITALDWVRESTTVLYDHRYAGKGGKMTPPEVARALVAFNAFDINEMPNETVSAKFGSQKHAPLAVGAMASVHGSDVFKILSRNILCNYSAHGKDDVPSWEREPLPLLGNLERHPDGLADLFSWRSRRLEIIWDAVGNAIGVRIASGEKFPKKEDFKLIHRADDCLNPFWYYGQEQKAKKMAREVVSLSPARQFWRDADALVAAGGESDAGRRPEIYSQYGANVARLSFPPIMNATVIGVWGNQASLQGWSCEHLPIPASVLAATDPTHWRRAAGFANVLVEYLNKAVGRMAISVAKGDKKGAKIITSQIKSLVTQHYCHVIGQTFSLFLSEISNGGDEDAKRDMADAWIKKVERVAKDSLGRTEAIYGYRILAAGRQSLENSLYFGSKAKS